MYTIHCSSTHISAGNSIILGDRKKWNFRKTSTSEASSNDGPSPTFGLINQSSEAKSKPTMIFENALSDHDEPNDLQVKSPPTSLNISQTASQQTRTSPKVPSVDQQQGPKVARARQRSLPSSPPAMIIRPQSARKPTDRVYRKMSVPMRQQSATLLPQQPLQSPSSIQGRNYVPHLRYYFIHLFKYFIFLFLFVLK